MLGFDDALNAGMAEDVGAGSDDRGVESIKADRAVFAGFDAELEQVLEGFLVLWCKVDNFLVVESGENGGYAISTELPVVAYLSHSKQNLQEMAHFTWAFALLVYLKKSLCFGSTQC